jgi:hypothetical protein
MPILTANLQRSATGILKKQTFARRCTQISQHRSLSSDVDQKLAALSNQLGAIQQMLEQGNCHIGCRDSCSLKQRHAELITELAVSQVGLGRACKANRIADLI